MPGSACTQGRFGRVLTEVLSQLSDDWMYLRDAVIDALQLIEVQYSIRDLGMIEWGLTAATVDWSAFEWVFNDGGEIIYNENI